jgi:hypothetical protein
VVLLEDHLFWFLERVAEISESELVSWRNVGHPPTSPLFHLPSGPQLSGKQLPFILSSLWLAFVVVSHSHLR